MSTCAELYEIRKFIEFASPNERMLYATCKSLQDSILTKNIANLIYDDAVKGIVYLVQTRNPNDRSFFDYYIIKASKIPVVRLVPYPKDILVDRHSLQAERQKARSLEWLNKRLSLQTSQ